MQADDAGFIDAHNWLFTARGIPVVYYGSEIGFRAGLAEHKGNRDYFGSDNIRAARSHPVRAALARVANLRRNSVALQRGVQVNLAFTEDTAAFLRVYRHAGQSETALVLLNGSDEPRRVDIEHMPAGGAWQEADGTEVEIRDSKVPQSFEVPPHGVRVLMHGTVAAAGLTDDQLRRDQRRFHGMALDQAHDGADHGVRSRRHILLDGRQ